MKYEYHQFLKDHGITNEKEFWKVVDGKHQNPNVTAIEMIDLYYRKYVEKGFIDLQAQFLWQTREDYGDESITDAEYRHSVPLRAYLCDRWKDSLKQYGINEAYFVADDKAPCGSQDIYIFDNYDEAKEYLDSLAYSLIPSPCVVTKQFEEKLGRDWLVVWSYDEDEIVYHASFEKHEHRDNERFMRILEIDEYKLTYNDLFDDKRLNEVKALAKDKLNSLIKNQDREL